MENISFKKNWQDDEISEVEICAQSSMIVATTKVYNDEKKILELSTSLQSFLDEKSNIVCGRMGRKESVLLHIYR